MPAAQPPLPLQYPATSIAPSMLITPGETYPFGVRGKAYIILLLGSVHSNAMNMYTIPNQQATRFPPSSSQLLPPAAYSSPNEWDLNMGQLPDEAMALTPNWQSPAATAALPGYNHQTQGSTQMTWTNSGNGMPQAMEHNMQVYYPSYLSAINAEDDSGQQVDSELDSTTAGQLLCTGPHSIIAR
ncbi:hypothetical protein DL93DRAFT_2075562 [Clavulina sp. PMI_390]|nr:hypothetical protein DL93DRAFT_2075562 [Clavulina sp. PMI_390]